MYLIVLGRKKKKSANPYTVISVAEFRAEDLVITGEEIKLNADMTANSLNEAYQLGVFHASKKKFKKLKFKKNQTN